MSKKAKIQKAHELANDLSKLKLIDLEFMKADTQNHWMNKYPGLDQKDFDDVRRQVTQVKMTQQSLIGWQVIPRDLAVIGFSITSIYLNLPVGVITGVVILIMAGSLFRLYYSERLNKILSFSVWLTYPALIWLGYTLLRDGYAWWMVIGIILMAWLGSFAIDFLIRFALRHFLELRADPKYRKKQK